MIPVAEARRFVLSACGALTPRPVALSDASGHVLAETIRAFEAVPPFTNSAMDGYAVRADDTARTPARLRVVGSVMAGDDAKTFVSPGESVRIMTGAPLPPGADAVCMVERTRVEAGGSIVFIEESVRAGTNVRNVGGRCCNRRGGVRVRDASRSGSSGRALEPRRRETARPPVSQGGRPLHGRRTRDGHRCPCSWKDPRFQPSGAARAARGRRLRCPRPRRDWR